MIIHDTVVNSGMDALGNSYYPTELPSASIHLAELFTVSN